MGKITLDHSSIGYTGDLFSLIASLELPFTDIMVTEGQPSYVLMPSGWEKLKYPAPTREHMQSFFSNLDIDWETNLIKDGALSGAYRTTPLESLNHDDSSHEDARPDNELPEDQGWALRINGFLIDRGMRLRIIARRVLPFAPSLADTGLPSSVTQLASATKGLILISGSTGSGKSTTLAAFLDEINKHKKTHIITIEDPIEYTLNDKRSIISQRQVGVDTPNFTQGLKSALRQTPGVLAIGEILDKETMDIALRAGESGHLVIGTIHANCTHSTINKVIGFFQDNEIASKRNSLQNCLIGVISQALLPRKDGTGFQLAAEILINNKHTHSESLFDSKYIANLLQNRTDKLSQSMGFSLTKLVEDDIIHSSDAYAVTGLSQVDYQRIREASNSKQTIGTPPRN